MENDLTHQKLVRYSEGFYEKTQAGHCEGRVRRDYYNNIQHTAEELATLRKRKQPIVTDNRIKRKVDYLLGVERQTRTDPKCFPRTPQDEDASQVFTDAIRFVCDNNDWDIERSEGFDYLCVEGIEAHMIDVEYINDEPEIKERHIPWDRFIYDPHSRDRFFRDAKFKGVLTWMDVEDAQEMFPERKQFINASPTQTNTVFNDKPDDSVWSDSERKRVLVILLDFIQKGVWHRAIFTREGFLVDPAPSTWLDEHGRPESNIVAGGAFIDKDNDRYGIVRQMISMQDLINKKHSKYQHLMSNRQTYGNAKAVKDVNKTKMELSKPDGHVEVNGNAVFGQDFGILPTGDMAVGEFNILQSAISSIDGMGQGDIVDSTASGRSKEISQNSNLIELGPLFDTHRQVSKLVYKQIFNRIKQFWTGHKYVRITDDERNIEFSELNKPVTGADMLIERYGKEQGQQIIQQYQGDPRLSQVAEIRNQPSQVNVDIIVDDAPDVVNIQAEQFELLAKMYQANPDAVPIDMIIEASDLRNKDRILEHLKGGDEQQQEAHAKKAQKEEELSELFTISELEDKAASIKEKQARAKKLEVEAEAQEIENELTTESISMNFG